MGIVRALTVLIGLFAWFCPWGGICAQQPYTTALARILKAVRTGSLKQGDTFLLRTTGAWTEANCALAPGTTVTGVVASLETTGSGSQRVVWGVRFDPISCAGDDVQQVIPLLVAMEGNSRTGSDNMTRLETAQTEFSAISALSNSHLDMDPLSNTGIHAAQPTYSVGSPSPEQRRAKTGEVIGVGKVKMVLPDATPVTTLMSAREIVLPEGTDLVLRFVKAPPAAKHHSAPVLVAREATPESHPLRSNEAADIQDVCVASGCKQLVPSIGDTPGQAAWTFPLKSLGYSPRLQQTITSLQDETTVHYLGADQILLTFPIYGLQHRSGRYNTQRIRAVLLSAGDGHVLAMQEWTVVASEGAYLWPLGEGRLLVHVGDELVCYGAGLTVQQRFPLPGQLVFASTSSDGSLILAAVVHERYDPQQYQRMADYLGRGVPVPEDYDLIGLNGELREISTRRLHEEPARPALLSSGIVAAEQRKPGVWNVEEISLAGSRKRLAELRSSCGIQVNALAGGLLLVRSCEGYPALQAFRLLNAQGATLLKGSTPYAALFQQAGADAQASEVAIAMSQFDTPPNMTAGVPESEFKSLSVRVYRTGSGKQVFLSKPPAGSMARQTMALSPGGDHLAVLTDTAVQTYAVP